MSMRVLCIGISHKTADVALRELLAFDAAQARSALEMLRDECPEGQFVILSTCNRSELYVMRPIHGGPREDELRNFLSRFHDLPRERFDGALYVLTEAEAVRHLFAVAAGLDSLVPGEDQIQAQLKAAHGLSRSLNVCGGELHDLIQFAFNVAKHARSQTRIAAGKVSVASVAAELAGQRAGGLPGKCLLSVGAGKTNALMLRHLKLAGAERILVANRSPARARELADACGGSAIPFQDLPEALAQADLVLCSTGASDPVITVGTLAPVLARRGGRGLLIIDIAVPRDVEEAVGRLPGVTLLNIDDLRRVVEANVALRTSQMDACEMIIDEHVAEYFHRLHVREVAPAIEDLYRRMRAVADEEIAAARNRFTGRAEDDEQVMRHAFHRALRRILHVPMSNLRAAAGSDSARQQADALLRLFNLPAPDGRTDGDDRRARP